jgi:photosystem II stability/assembly factor-like uncharacterized protein
MKRLAFAFFPILSVLVAVGMGFAATEEWHWQNPTPQGNTLYDVDQYNASTAVAVGVAGTVIRMDSGGPWLFTPEAGGVQTSLVGVAYAGASTIVAVGEEGVIVRSSDGGATWAVITSGTTELLRKVSFGDASHGTAVGSNGTILHTDDGGITWLPQSSGTSEELLDVCMVDALTATAVGSAGTILRTTDGGATWVAQSSGVSAALAAVDCINASTAVAVGTGNLILRTTDGGANWAVVPNPASWTFSMRDVAFTSATHGVAIGYSDQDPTTLTLYLRTSDGGATWTDVIVDVMEGSSAWALSFGDTDNGLTVGESGAVYKTTDGGGNWSLAAGSAYRGQLTGVAVKRDTIVAVDPGPSGFSFGSARFLRSTDGGVTWTSGGVSYYWMYDVAFADSSTVYAVGRGPGFLDVLGAVMKSTDAGATWTLAYEEACWPGKPNCVPPLNAVGFSDAGNGIAVGWGGGATIPGFTQFQAGSANLLDVAMPTPSTAVAVGGGGTIVVSLDGGVTWVPVGSGTTNTLYGVCFSNSTTGFAVGALGTVLRTTDGGFTWTDRSGWTTETLTAVSLYGGLGYIATANGNVFCTDDGGAHWLEVPTGCANGLWDIEAFAGTHAVAVGSGQTVIRLGEPPVGSSPGIAVDPAYTITNCVDPATYAVVYDTTGVVGLPDEVRGYDADFSIDPAIATVSAVVEKNFLKKLDFTLFDHTDHGDGTHTVSCVLLGGGSGATDPDSLFQVFVTPVGEGVSAIAFTSIVVRDEVNQPIEVTGTNGVIQVDCTPPWMEPIVEDENEYYNTPPAFATFTFHDDVNLDRAVYQIDAAAWDTLFSGVDDTVWSSPGYAIPQAQFDALSEGPHTIAFLVADDAGNDSTFTWSFIVDRLAPWMDPLVEPEDEYYNTAPTFATFRFHDESNLDRAEYQVDGGGWTAIVTALDTTDWNGDGWTLPGVGSLSEGPHTAQFRAWDDAGNVSAVTSWGFIKDTAAPAAPMSFVATPGHKKVHLSWDNPVGDTTLAGVMIRRSNWGDYPEYATSAPAYPASESAGDSVAVTLAPTDSTTELVVLRDIYYYAAFTFDHAGNVSSFDLEAADRATNYWLGDVDSLGFSEGAVNLLDLVIFSGAFREAEGDPGWVAECDFGPTDDLSSFGVPLPDDVIDFEDLMIFAMNYDSVDASGVAPRLIAESPGELRERVDFRLETRRAGDNVTISIVMENSARGLKGVLLRVDHGFTGDLVAVEPGELLTGKVHRFFSGDDIQTGVVEISIAALGSGRALVGSGEVARLVVNAGQDPVGVRFDRIELRNIHNEREQIDNPGGDTPTPYVPSVSALIQNHPNPFNPATTITYDIAAPGTVTLRIYDVSGRLVTTLVNGHRGVGRHRADWDGRDRNGTHVGTGVYFYRMTAPAYEPVARKMLLLK